MFAHSNILMSSMESRNIFIVRAVANKLLSIQFVRLVPAMVNVIKITHIFDMKDKKICHLEQLIGK